MSKNKHRTKAERIYDKAHGSEPFNYEKAPHQIGELTQKQTIQTKAAGNDRAIQLRAYQIHQEKGGSDLDNWLEAERILSNGHN